MNITPADLWTLAAVLMLPGVGLVVGFTAALWPRLRQRTRDWLSTVGEVVVIGGALWLAGAWLAVLG